jgi:hypothetical protein
VKLEQVIQLCGVEDLLQPAQQLTLHHGLGNSIPACSNPCIPAARHPIWCKCETVSTQGYLCIPLSSPAAGVPPNRQ